MFRQDPALAQVKWVFPHAPSIPITFKSGQIMPGWCVLTCTVLCYDLKIGLLHRFDLFEPGFKWDEMDKACTPPRAWASR
jgi:hypothetical protein